MRDQTGMIGGRKCIAVYAIKTEMYMVQYKKYTLINIWSTVNVADAGRPRQTVQTVHTVYLNQN
jgi:hypothetical protein